MTKSLSLIAFILSTSLLWAQVTAADDAELLRSRLIVITDIGTEPDDIQSMVRLLTYANDLDIEGLIAASSRHLRDRVHPEFIEKRIAAYAEVLPNLRIHDTRYPDADSLKQVVRAADPVYGMEGVGKGKHTAAAQLIIDAVDSPDPRPVWVSIWGGAAPLAEALWRVKESRTPEQVKAFVAKLRVYSISDQDDSGPWARMLFPELFWVTSIHAFTDYRLSTWVGMMTKEPWTNPEMISNDWLNTRIRNQGPLGALYPLPIFGVEGDTPSFLYLIPNGLGLPERPDWGSWGGRYGKIADFLGLWTDTADTAEGSDGKSHTGNDVTVWRWRQDFQNDFAARMAWTTVDTFAGANHAPQPVLNGKTGTAPVVITACPGETIRLTAEGSTDPDDQALDFGWQWYQVEPAFSPRLSLSHDQGQDTRVTIPSWTQPDGIPLPDAYELHVILTARDTGTPVLTRYRRAVISVLTGGGESLSGLKCQPVALAPASPVTDFTDSPAAASAGHFSTGDSLGVLLDNPATRSVLEKHLPELVKQAEVSEQARGMTLIAVKHFDSRLTEDVLAAIDRDLSAIAAPE